MTVIRSVVNIPARSGIPEDAAQNVWHFILPENDPFEGDFADIGVALNAFYCADPSPSDPDVNAVMTYISGSSVHPTEKPLVHHYVLDENGLSGSPQGLSELINWVPGNGTPLPAEAAICLSFAADLEGIAERIPGGAAGPAGDTLPRQRRRGRIFLPFLGSNVVTASASGARPSLNARKSLVWGAQMLVAQLDGMASSISWAVFSKVDLVARAVEVASCDDAFDTQRRRGMAPSSTFSEPVRP